MYAEVPNGTYVIGVSGGVDSIALLHMLSVDKGKQLVIAHVNHGMRDDSIGDAALVKKLANEYGLLFELATFDLGADASEEHARDVRYNFFKIIQSKYGARGIITAHHKDDILETAIINIARGTGRHGLSSLQSSDFLVRPLLHLTKEDLVKYARSNRLSWSEDSTNSDEKYLRNHVRASVVSRMNPTEKSTMHGLLATTKSLNSNIDSELENYLTRKSYRKSGLVFSRSWFNHLPHAFACEIVHSWLRLRVIETNKKFVDNLVLKIKTARPGASLDIGSNSSLELTKRSIRLPSVD